MLIVWQHEFHSIHTQPNNIYFVVGEHQFPQLPQLADGLGDLGEHVARGLQRLQTYTRARERSSRVVSGMVVGR